jgi:hypothetical protein
MYSADSRAARAIMHARQQEATRVAQASLLYRRLPHLPPAWIPRPGCWLLCQLGSLLVNLGRRLQRYGLALGPFGMSTPVSPSH